jgi:hypothetical protein
MDPNFSSKSFTVNMALFTNVLVLVHPNRMGLLNENTSTSLVQPELYFFNQNYLIFFGHMLLVMLFTLLTNSPLLSCPTSHLTKSYIIAYLTMNFLESLALYVMPILFNTIEEN